MRCSRGAGRGGVTEERFLAAQRGRWHGTAARWLSPGSSVEEEQVF